MHLTQSRDTIHGQAEVRVIAWKLVHTWDKGSSNPQARDMFLVALAKTKRKVLSFITQLFMRYTSLIPVLHVTNSMSRSKCKHLLLTCAGFADHRGHGCAVAAARQHARRAQAVRRPHDRAKVLLQEQVQCRRA